MICPGLFLSLVVYIHIFYFNIFFFFLAVGRAADAAWKPSCVYVSPLVQ